MALFAYLKQVERLMLDTRQLRLNPDDLISYVNVARGQVAGEGECIRTLGTVLTTIGQRNYSFTDLSIGSASVTGRAGVMHVRSIMYSVGDGQQWITPRAWEWFQLFHMNNPVPENGSPTTWAQFAQGAGAAHGSAGTGSFYLDPPPDIAYTLTCDCVCYPSDLVDDTTVEAIPYPWTDAVPFYAAYYAYLTLQAGKLVNESERMFQIYQKFVARARQFSNPSVNRPIYEQSVDPTMLAKLGMQQRNPPAQGAG